MSDTESIEILSDAGEVLALSPLPADLLTEGSTGEIRDFKTSMKVERDGRAANWMRAVMDLWAPNPTYPK